MQTTDSRARRLLACLGDPSRFRVVTILHSGECCVSEIAARVGLSQPCATRHLQVLQREGLVAGARQGKRVLFRLRLDEPAVRGLIEWAIERDSQRHSGGGAPGKSEADTAVRQDPRAGHDHARQGAGARVGAEVLEDGKPTGFAGSPVRTEELEDYLL